MPILTIISENDTHQLDVATGTNLRVTLLANGFSPYVTFTKRLNCGGRGLCATCGVWIQSGEPSPQHWHDKAAFKFGYPRLSCQITINDNMTIQILDDKVIWGSRDNDRADQLHNT